ncbi:phage baseplate assembly protein V [Azotobacter chroococcum]|uniref:phage baseplate assembly protein V n=1 Tax=Azotobacter chroococcum TaxID=353 RepID=UPI0010ADC905|nr:phage baseplate assembly protein V [Azotobacter chroococcum]TKD47380.1 baseplate assembly protein [Azotobacter chroococcum]
MSTRPTMESLHYTEEFSRREDWQAPPEPPDAVDGIKRFWGKYRGTVLPMPDIDRRGRLMVQVTDAHGPNFSGWALPCLPWAGPGMGAFVVPPPGTNVWVEFEQGHPDQAIWCGFWWGEPLSTPDVAKTSAPLMPIFALQTILKHHFTMTDTPMPPYLPTGGILLGSLLAGIAIDSTGVRIFGPTVQVNGTPGGQPPNAAALLVMP